MSNTIIYSQNLKLFFHYLYTIGFEIVIPIICVIGLILNVLCFIVFLRPKEKIYFYLAIKSFGESLLLMLGAILPYETCLNCNLEDTYMKMMFILITQKFLKQVIYLSITILEIEISFNRLFLITSHQLKILIVRKDKLKVFVYIFISCAIFSPTFFAFEIIKKDFNDEYQLVYTDFGRSRLFYYFYVFFLLFENVLSIIILLPLNIIILIKFKKFIKNKSKNLTTIATVNELLRQNNVSLVRIQENAKTESKFTRMIVLISFIFIFSRLFEASVQFLNIYNMFHYNNSYYTLYLSILNIFVFANTNITFSFNFIIFYIFNQTFKKNFNEIFCCQKK